eukprot:TRINITY_DN4485_c0_g1_i3.p1 TRINITY_DN4485_c0_g1~~TRINITY_DN4485_c0_g1_i3.p1  ORF type:complete len:534 (-),score=138.95 TRINITY_DN4485_c0_g1_i3:153-1754(-)
MDTILDRRLQSIGLSFAASGATKGIDEYASFAKGKIDQDTFSSSASVDPPADSFTSGNFSNGSSNRQNISYQKSKPSRSYQKNNNYNNNNSHAQHSGKDPLTMVHEMVTPLSPLLSPLLIQHSESPNHSPKKRRVEETLESDGNSLSPQLSPIVQTNTSVATVSETQPFTINKKSQEKQREKSPDKSGDRSSERDREERSSSRKRSRERSVEEEERSSRKKSRDKGDKRYRDDERDRRERSTSSERRRERKREERGKEEKKRKKEKSSSSSSSKHRDEKERSKSSSSSKRRDTSPTTSNVNENVAEITQEAIKLKRLADKETDKKQGILYYIQSGLKFLRCAFINEKRKDIKGAERLYIDTAAFFDGISKNAIETSPHLASICYQCMGVAMMRRFLIGEKMRSIKDDIHNLEKSQNNNSTPNQSSQTPSPFPQSGTSPAPNNNNSPSSQLQNGKESNGSANTPPTTNTSLNLRPTFTKDVGDMAKVFDAFGRAEYHSKESKRAANRETNTIFGIVPIPSFIEGVLKDLHEEES